MTCILTSIMLYFGHEILEVCMIDRYYVILTGYILLTVLFGMGCGIAAVFTVLGANATSTPSDIPSMVVGALGVGAVCFMLLGEFINSVQRTPEYTLVFVIGVGIGVGLGITA